MKTGFENEFTLSGENTVEQINVSHSATNLDKHLLITNLNKTPDYGDPDCIKHPEIYSLMDVQKWLNAHIAYQQLPHGVADEFGARSEQETDAALRDGTFLRLSTDTIDDHIRNMGVHMFVDDSPKDSMDNQDAVAHQNRLYFEAWLMLREQAHRHVSPNGPELSSATMHDMILAKKLYQDACRTTQMDDKQKTLSQSLAISLNCYDSLLEQDAPPSATVITTKNLIAHTLYHLARLGEFGDDHTAADHLAIELLWQNAEDLRALEPGIIPTRIQQKYLDEIEYLRGQYSEAIGIDPNRRPNMQVPPERVKQALGKNALTLTAQRVV